MSDSPSLRARIIRVLIRVSVGRRFRRPGVTLAEIRRVHDLMISSQRPPKGTKVEPWDLRGFSGEWVRGPGAGTEAILLFLHGGALVSGSPAGHRELTARISAASGLPVLSLEYRLAPEHPFPAALEDVLAAYRWLLAQGHGPQRLFLGGESAGGGLALQAVLRMREEGTPLPRGVAFLSPVTDWVRLDGESFRTRASLDPLASPQLCRFTASLYVGNAPADTPLLCPRAMDLSGLPPLWIQAGDHDVLLSDSEMLAVRAREAGVSVDFRVWPGLWHVFQGAARLVPEGRKSIQELGRFLRRHSPGA